MLLGHHRKVTATCAGLTLLLTPVPALASGESDSGIEVEGRCSAGTKWQLEAEAEHGGAKVEWELRSGNPGEQWDYTLSAAGQSWDGSARASDEGRLKVERALAALTEGQEVRATADSRATGENCEGLLRITGTLGGHPSSDDGHGDDSPDHGSTDDRDSSSDDLIRNREQCSQVATVSLAVRPLAKRIKLRVVIDSNDAGERWKYRVKRSKRTITKGVARTRGDRGRLVVTKKVKSKGGGLFRVAAKNTDAPDRCRVRVRR